MRSRKRKATLCYRRNTGPRPNRRLQLTAFGARDRWFFDAFLCSAPRRQLKRSTLDGAPSTIFQGTASNAIILNQEA